MSLAVWAVLFVSLQRLGELILARRNTRGLLAEGGREAGAGHYPLIVALHGAWLGWLWYLAAGDPALQWPYLAAYGALQPARAWTMASLGRNWTTRIITVPGRSLVRRGPYRFCRHPNYLIVAAEIVAMPLALGDWAGAAMFSTANAGLIGWRMRVEDRALRPTDVNK